MDPIKIVQTTRKGMVMAAAPEVTADELRQKLAGYIHEAFGAEAARVIALDVCVYQPVAHTIEHAQAIDRQLKAQGMPPGGMFQVVGAFCCKHDSEKRAAFRFELPRCIPYDELPRVGQGLIEALVQGMARLDRDYRPPVDIAAAPASPLILPPSVAAA